MDTIEPVETIKLKDYERLPFVYNDDGSINKLNLKIGGFYRMRDTGQLVDIGSRVSVYRVIRLTPNGDESMMTTLTIE
jgi:hypothetical protein